jgi:hypothetical protein
MITNLYSIIVPVMDEQDSLPGTLLKIHFALYLEGIPHEFIVVEQANKAGKYPSCEWIESGRKWVESSFSPSVSALITAVRQTTDFGFASLSPELL